MLNLEELKHELNTQDVRATSHPLYIVYDTEQVPTDGDYSDDFYYRDPHGECEFTDLKAFVRENMDEDELKAFESTLYLGKINSLENIDDEDLFKMLEVRFEIYKVYYLKKPKFITVCLTQKGADAYIERHKHNLHEPYVYVESAYGNAEMIEIQEYFKNCVGKTLNQLRRENGMEPLR